MDTVLLVTPHFPPSSLAGVHRARHMAKHLPSHGWRPIVVRVDPRHYIERGDPELATLVPPSVEQVFTGAIPAAMTRRFGVGDIGLRAFPHLRHAVMRLAAKEHPKAVFITGSPYYPMLMAQVVTRRYGIPVILDFQDPWVSAWGAKKPKWSKSGLSHRLATLLEPRVLKGAAFITSVSDRQNTELVARHPWLDADSMAEIPIGGDPEDFTALRDGSAEQAAVALDPQRFELSYVGSFWPGVVGPLTAFLRALRTLKTHFPESAARLRVNFIGTDPRLLEDEAQAQVEPIARVEGVADIVREIPFRLPFLQALSTMSNSSALLLIGSDEPHYTASKIYPAMMSGRPFLSLFHVASSAHRILRTAGGGVVLGFDTAECLAGREAEIAEALHRLITRPESVGRVDPSGYAAYTAHSVAGRFAEIFSSLGAAR